MPADLLGLVCLSPASLAVAALQDARAVSVKDTGSKRYSANENGGKQFFVLLCSSRNEHTAARADHNTGFVRV